MQSWGGSGLPPATVPTVYWTNSVAFAAGGRAFYGRSLGAGSISKIGLFVGTQSGNLCVGIYSSNGGSTPPQQLIISSGIVPCPISGFAIFPLGQAININESNYFALAADTAVAAFASVGAGPGGSSIPGFQYQSTLTGNMPLPPTPDSSMVPISQWIPVMWGLP